MTITELKTLLNPNHYYIVVYNIDAYAEGVTGMNYNMIVHHIEEYHGWKTKKDLAKSLSQVKKDNKSTKKIPNSNICGTQNIGQYNTIKVMKPQELIDAYHRSTVIHYSIFHNEIKEITGDKEIKKPVPPVRPVPTKPMIIRAGAVTDIKPPKGYKE